jgi:HlyD family secretion protein
VQRGAMLRDVRAPGTLVPRDVRWLASATPALVSRIEVLPGTPVAKDTVLLRLTNPEVEDNLRNAEAEVAAAQAQVEARRTELQLELLSQRAAMAQAQADYAVAKVKADADAEAAKQQLIARVQFEQGQIALRQLQTRMEIEQQRVAAFAAGLGPQLAAAQGELQQRRNNLELRKRQAEALEVRAGIDGVLQEIAVQEGQQVAAGTSLARVARPEPLIARLRVPEFQVRDVAIGKPAEIDTYNGLVNGRVTRVDPVVVDGTVRVDVELAGKLPAGARPDLSIEGRIRIDTLADVLSVGRPARASATGEVTLYRLDASGNTATRVPVRLGAQSANRVQVLAGLQEGDRVILSDSSPWAQQERIRLD